MLFLLGAKPDKTDENIQVQLKLFLSHEEYFHWYGFLKVK